MLLEPAATKVADHRGPRHDDPELGSDEYALR